MRSVRRTLVLLVASALLALASQPQDATTSYSPQEMVRRMVRSETRAQQEDKSKWHFMSRREQDGKVVTIEKVQTIGGTLKRTIALNGKPLPPEERAKENKKLEEFAKDPSAIEKRRREERADAEKARKMFEMFPDAFLYTHAGEEDGLVKLHFTPNPKFDPPTREATVFHAMSGTMWIEPKQMRFARMQASLTDDVKFGWGLLGHLDRGGTMFIEQKEIAPGHWEVTKLDLDMKGKAIFFKSISVQQKEENFQFERVNDLLDLAQGLALLKHEDESIAGAGGK